MIDKQTRTACPSLLVFYSKYCWSWYWVPSDISEKNWDEFWTATKRGAWWSVALWHTQILISLDISANKMIQMKPLSYNPNLNWFFLHYIVSLPKKHTCTLPISWNYLKRLIDEECKRFGAWFCSITFFTALKIGKIFDSIFQPSADKNLVGFCCRQSKFRIENLKRHKKRHFFLSEHLSFDSDKKLKSQQRKELTDKKLKSSNYFQLFEMVIVECRTQKNSTYVDPRTYPLDSASYQKEAQSLHTLTILEF